MDDTVFLIIAITDKLSSTAYSESLHVRLWKLVICMCKVSCYIRMTQHCFIGFMSSCMVSESCLGQQLTRIQRRNDIDATML